MKKTLALLLALTMLLVLPACSGGNNALPDQPSPAEPPPAEETVPEPPEPEAPPEPETEALEPVKVPTKVKGIYLSAYVAGTESMIDSILEQIDQTEINAVVIDVKDDNGRITFRMNTPMVQEIGAVKAFIPDIQSLMKKLKERNIYTIARVVAFRDPYLPEKKPDLALKLPDGSTYRDNKGLAWVNPYKKETWD